MLYPPIILASASPRRATLLEQVGIPFEAMPSEIDESYPRGVSPQEAAESIARAKAIAVANVLDDRKGPVAVLGADTVVLLDGHVLEKPVDSEEAREMLRRLSGRTHEVLTGVALVWLRGPDRPDRVESWRVETRVTFRRLHDAEIDAYVRSGRPLDKAGAYGIQEDAAAFVTRVEGCYFNVVGLPLARLSERLLVHARPHEESP